MREASFMCTMEWMATITFYGGAGTVTGANFLLDLGAPEGKILIDCGAHEREDLNDPKNHAPFPYKAGEIKALLVTHAHQDHIGRIPKLVAEGFHGAIYSTAPTKALSELMFQDALHVMEQEIQHGGGTPLYTQQDVQKALSLWQTHPYHEPFLTGDASVEFLDAGHILGSAMMRITRNERSIVFTGDLGNTPEPLLNDTERAAGANYILMESVYGDRVHEERAQRVDVLRYAVDDARKRRGTLLIPSFSIERTQIILFELHKLMEEGKLERVPVYLDAPLAEKINGVYREYRQFLNADAQQHFQNGDIFSFPGLVEVHSTGESRTLHNRADPKVIIAGAGMSNGGRVRAHEKRYLPDSNASILLTGYQAPGSLGRRIADGEKEVHIDGEAIPVHAKIGILTGFSGHRDRDGLLQFVDDAHEKLEKVFVTMGEPKASLFLAQRIKDFLGIDAVVPQQNDTVTIDV